MTTNEALQAIAFFLGVIALFQVLNWWADRRG